ncbi:MAG: hypothetical protein RL757_2719 [Bacteroidota bacterium]
MNVKVATYKSQHFQNEVNELSFKENNFVFKRTRSLMLMIQENLNYSHIVKIEKKDFPKPLYQMKIAKDLRVILTLEEDAPSEFTLTLLRAIRLHQLDEAVEILAADETCSSFNFKDFWT